MNIIFFYVTIRSKVEAAKIAHHLLKKKLIACANIFPITSIYEWKGKIRDEKEVVLILKTLKIKSIAVKNEIKRIHSYEIPCITEIKVEPNDAYARWLQEQVR